MWLRFKQYYDNNHKRIDKIGSSIIEIGLYHDYSNTQPIRKRDDARIHKK
jgi:hypothetical protein